MRTHNRPQLGVFEEIKADIDSGAGGLYFIDAPARTGKTFLSTTLLGYTRQEEEIALVTASSGIVATFCLPVPEQRTLGTRFPSTAPTLLPATSLGDKVIKLAKSSPKPNFLCSGTTCRGRIDSASRRSIGHYGTCSVATNRSAARSSFSSATSASVYQSSSAVVASRLWTLRSKSPDRFGPTSRSVA